MNFTNKELHASLSELADMFERDDVKVRGFDMDVCAKRYDDGITLGHSDHRSHCGTVACIGGWIWLLNKEEPLDNGEYAPDAHERATEFVSEPDPDDPDKLYHLFYPKEVANWSDIAPKEAAAAIRNYIADGDPQWESVVDRENLVVNQIY
jgi:hypothetical protein